MEIYDETKPKMRCEYASRASMYSMNSDETIAIEFVWDVAYQDLRRTKIVIPEKALRGFCKELTDFFEFRDELNTAESASFSGNFKRSIQVSISDGKRVYCGSFKEAAEFLRNHREGKNQDESPIVKEG